MRLQMQNRFRDQRIKDIAAHKKKKMDRLYLQMFKIERKLSKYRLQASQDVPSDCESELSVESVGFRSRSRGCDRNWHSRVRERHCRRDRSSDSSGSDSSDDSVSGKSSRSASPSPCRRRHRRRHEHGPQRQSRSRSFAGHAAAHLEGNCKHRRLHHRSQSPRKTARSWFVHYRDRHPTGDASYRRMDAESENPNASPEQRADVVDLANETEQAEFQGEQMDLAGEAEDGPEMDESLARSWSDLIRKGLPAGEREALLNKYPISANCSSLRGPKLNEEIVERAPLAVVQRDLEQMHLQAQIGSGLSALARVVSELNERPVFQRDEKLVDVAEMLSDAANLILDVHRDMTRTRRDLLMSNFTRTVQTVAKSCESDEFLFGGDFGKKLKGSRHGARGKKVEKDQRGEGAKRKHADNNKGTRKPRRLEVSESAARECAKCNRHGSKKH